MENPYQAPGASIGLQPTATALAWSYKDSSTLTRIVRIALVASMLASIATILSDFRQRGLLHLAEANGMSVDEAWGEFPLDALLVPLGLLAVGLFTIITIAMWIHRMARNARALLGASRLEYTPGWTVGWYFIPFANLWKPYQAFKDVWIGSFEGKEPRGVANSGPLPLWWTLWLAYSFVSNISARMSLRASTFDDEYLSLTFSTISEIINLPLCLVFLFIVNRLYARQTELNAAVSSNGATAVSVG